MLALQNIDVPIDRIEAFCRKWKIVEFPLFGSILREDFGPRSEVDVLGEFAEDAPRSLYRLDRDDRRASRNIRT